MIMTKVPTARMALILVITVMVGMTRVSCTAVSQKDLSLLPIPDIFDPKIKQCWDSVQGIEGCLLELLSSFATLRINLDPKCCKAIEEIGDNCFKTIFGAFPFASFFPPLLESFCSAIPQKTPPPVLVLPPADR